MNHYFISCDWGTSNLRMYLVEKKSLSIIAEISNENGIKDFYYNWVQSGQKRSTFYRHFLEEQIKLLGEKVALDLSETIVIASGMITSSLGYKELPYVKVPIKLDTGQLINERSDQMILISGVCTDKDVMRGEETQIMGVLMDHMSSSATFILPGTHSKHAYVQNGCLIDFKTFLTGEIFQLLTQESSLSHSLENCEILGVPILEDQFIKGVVDSKGSNFLNKIFHVRANALLTQISNQENFAYLSGIVIGTELMDLKHDNQSIILCGEKKLCRLYELALQCFNDRQTVYYQDKLAVIKGQYQFIKDY